MGDKGEINGDRERLGNNMGKENECKRMEERDAIVRVREKVIG